MPCGPVNPRGPRKPRSMMTVFVLLSLWQQQLFQQLILFTSLYEFWGASPLPYYENFPKIVTPSRRRKKKTALRQQNDTAPITFSREFCGKVKTFSSEFCRKLKLFQGSFAQRSNFFKGVLRKKRPETRNQFRKLPAPQHLQHLANARTLSQKDCRESATVLLGVS